MRPTTTLAPITPYLENLVRLAELRGQPPVKTPGLAYPHGAEASYRRKLMRIADQSFAMVRPLIDDLWRWQRMAEAEQARKDADEPPEETPAPTSPTVEREPEHEAKRAAEQNRPHTPAERAQLFLPIEIERTLIAAQRTLNLFADGIPPGTPEVIARDIERHAVNANLRVFRSLGVNPIDPGSALDRARDEWIRTNAALIKSQPRDVAERIGQIVREMVPAGSRWETIARRLEDEHGIAQRRAALIARDQVGKYNGDCNRLQQRAAGFNHYEWIGVMDNRERPTHVALQHSIWSWDNPPPIGHPGEPIQCRCSAVPVTSAEDIAKTSSWSAEELAARTAALGPTQAEGPDATEEEIRTRAQKEVASEVRLAGNRSAIGRF